MLSEWKVEERSLERERVHRPARSWSRKSCLGSVTVLGGRTLGCVERGGGVCSYTGSGCVG